MLLHEAEEWGIWHSHTVWISSTPQHNNNNVHSRMHNEAQNYKSEVIYTMQVRVKVYKQYDNNIWLSMSTYTNQLLSKFS